MEQNIGSIKSITEADAAEILGVKVKTLRAWRWQKKGPRYMKLGRLIRYNVVDINNYMQQHTVNTEEYYG